MMENQSPFYSENEVYKWPCSIAMLNYQRVDSVGIKNHVQTNPFQSDCSFAPAERGKTGDQWKNTSSSNSSILPMFSTVNLKQCICLIQIYTSQVPSSHIHDQIIHVGQLSWMPIPVQKPKVGSAVHKHIMYCYVQVMESPDIIKYMWQCGGKP